MKRRQEQAKEARQEPEVVNAVWQGRDIVLLSRDSSGSLVKRTKRAEFVCYLRASDVDTELERMLRATRACAGMKREGDWVRVMWRSWDELRRICRPGGWFEQKGIETFEADLSPVKRWMADTRCRIQRPRFAYLDLETDSRVPPRKAIDGEARILCWSLVFENGEAVLGMLEADTDEAEADLLEDLWNELLEVDLVLAWGGDGFDFPVLRKRTAARAIRVDPRRWLWLDQMELFRKFNMSAAESGDEKQSVALNAIAQKLLGVGKDSFDASLTYEAWAAGGSERRRLGKYNVKDARLMRGIEVETGFVELMFTLAGICGVFPDSYGMNATNFVEAFMLRLGLEQGQHFRSHWGYEATEQFAGAFVMDPTRFGIVRHVHVVDFSSLYPSIIQSFNLSPETHEKERRAPNPLNRPSYLMHSPMPALVVPTDLCCAPITNHFFFHSPVGVLPTALDRLKAMRKKFSDLEATLPPGTPETISAHRLSAGAKIMINSFYGVIGSVFSRFCHRETAESTAQGGVWLIKETIKAAESDQWGLRAMYGDTDSSFLFGCDCHEGATECAMEKRVADFVDWCNEELYPRILRERGCQRNEIKLAYEKAFERIIMVGKKRYAGKFLHYKGTRARADSKPEIKGLEYKRGDTARLARRMQKELIDMLLEGETDPNIIEGWVLGWRWRVLAEPMPVDDFLLAKRLSKPLASYKRKRKKDGTWGALPPHVEVARSMAERGMDVGEGTRIEYVVTSASTSKEPTRAVHIADLEEGDEDRVYVWESLTFPPSQRVLEACFPNRPWKRLLKGKRKPPRKAKAPKAKAGTRTPRKKRSAPSGQGVLLE